MEDGVSEESNSTEKIKVVDRRWFTEDGSPRADRPAPAPRTEPTPPPDPTKRGGSAPERAPAETASAGPEVRTGEGAKETSAGTSQVFLELVATLAQQAELLMVGGQGLPRQPEQARRLIDYLGVLETKTRGNLSMEEGQVLSNVVFQLRSMFLQAGR